jgi:hypothetical protein
MWPFERERIYMTTSTDITIDNMTREQIVGVLEKEGGYQCYDHEATEDLRETLRTDIARDILPATILPA